MTNGTLRPVLLGAMTAGLARTLTRRLPLVKFRRDVAVLNRGDYRPLLSTYAPDAVLVFAEGDHRWAGVHRGRDAIGRFLQEFVRAGLQGEIRDLFIQGWPWRMTIVARFDDFADGADGERLYENRTVLVVHTRWGRIVHQEDVYEDTGRIGLFEQRLRDLGRPGVVAGGL
jgi:ketosteroid isomerase-like protein